LAQAKQGPQVPAAPPAPKFTGGMPTASCALPPLRRSRSPCREALTRVRCSPKKQGSSPCSWPAPKVLPWHQDAGGTVRVGELDCYVSGAPPASGAGILVLAHDIWGANGPVLRSACDELATAGHLVVMPDIGRGRASGRGGAGEPEAGQQWLRLFLEAYAGKQLDPVLRLLKKASAGRVGAVGFASGAWAAAKISQHPSGVRASVWCHPSRLAGWELGEGESESELVSAVRAPTLILPSRDSPTLYADGDLARTLRCNGVESDVVYFKGASADWLTEQAGFWFSRHLLA